MVCAPLRIWAPQPATPDANPALSCDLAAETEPKRNLGIAAGVRSPALDAGFRPWARLGSNQRPLACEANCLRLHVCSFAGRRPQNRPPARDASRDHLRGVLGFLGQRTAFLAQKTAPQSGARLCSERGVTPASSTAATPLRTGSERPHIGRNAYTRTRLNSLAARGCGTRTRGKSRADQGHSEQSSTNNRAIATDCWSRARAMLLSRASRREYPRTEDVRWLGARSRLAAAGRISRAESGPLVAGAMARPRVARGARWPAEARARGRARGRRADRLRLPAGDRRARRLALRPLVRATVLARPAGIPAITGHRREEALEFAAHAVEELPGNELLIEWEQRIAAGEPRTSVDLTGP